MAGMKLVERPEPPAAINVVIVQIHASGFVPTEMEWPSTWTDRRDRDRTLSIPGHELAEVVTTLGKRSALEVSRDANATPKPGCTQPSCPSGTADDSAAVGRFMAYHRITMSNGT
jgi:hypothetical protein